MNPNEEVWLALGLQRARLYCHWKSRGLDRWAEVVPPSREELQALDDHLARDPGTFGQQYRGILAAALGRLN